MGGCCFLLQGPHGAGGLGQGSHSTWRVPVAGAAGVGAGEGRVSAVGRRWLLWLLSALRKSLRVCPVWGCSCSQVDVFPRAPPPQEAGSRGWLDVVLAAPGLAKLGISPVGTQRCWGKAAFDQSSSRGKVSEPCSFCEHAAGDMNEWGGFPFSSAQF